MFCKNCGNELNDNEKYCGKCGTKVDENKSKKEPIKIKLTHCLVVLALLFTIPICIVFMNKNQQPISSVSELKKDNTVTEKNNNSTNTNVTNNSQASSKASLSIIDKNTLEIKISAKTLINTMIDVKNESIKDDRNIHIPLTYTESLEDNNGEKVNAYQVGYETLSSPVYLIIANAKTDYIYRIAVYYPYSQQFGTELNETAIANYYDILGKALERLNQKDLYDTIISVRSYMEELPEDEEISSDWNIKGIHFTQSEGPTNKFGNISGFYCIYGTK